MFSEEKEEMKQKRKGDIGLPRPSYGYPSGICHEENPACSRGPQNSRELCRK